jgi:uncharacterized repeat protein (TIGR01451 family)
MQTSLTEIVSRSAAALGIVALCAGLAYGQSREHPSDSPGKNIIHIYPGTGVGPNGPASTGGTALTSANSITTTSFIVPPPLTYHGGPVMRNPINYLIFWQPKSSPQYAVPFPAPAAYQTGIETFFQHIGATPLYSIVTQYTDGGGAPPNSASWGGSWVDTNTTPPSGCNGTATGAVGATPNCPLTDADIQNEVEVAIKANPSWQVSNVNVEYFVFTPSNVGECSGLDSDTPTPDQSCWTISGGVGPGEGGDYCAYHSYDSNSRIYAYIPFGSNGACYPFFSTPFPNGATLDIVLSATSHEMIESNTDPHINGWIDSAGAEIGDKCAYQYGFVAPDGTDLLLNGNRYLIQTEWSNQVSGCAKRLTPFTDSLNIPQSLNFGDVLAGGSSSRTLSITNSGAAGSGNAANIIYTRLSAASDFGFSLPGVPPTWDTLNSGGTFPVNVLFAPFLPPRNATGAVIIDTDETPCDTTLLPKSGNSCNVSLSEIVNSLSAAVVTPPSISKAFGAPSVALGGNTSLSFTIVNPNTVGITGVGFTDTLPSGLTASSVLGSCGGGIISTGPPVSLTGAALAAGASCTFSVTITGSTPGIKNNVSGNVTSNEAGAGNQASATLEVISPPVITKSFVPNKFLPGGTTTVSFSIANPNNFAALTGVAFIDALPAGLVVAAPNGLTSTCGGVATATAGSGSINLTGGSIASSGSCTVTATVTAPEGIYNNSVQVTSTNGGTGNTSTATVFVATPPNLSKAFGAVSIVTNSSTALTFTLMNPNHTVTLDALTFSDTLPAGLVISTPNGLTGSCGGGTIVAPAGNNLITLGSASLPAGASCTFTINVTSNGTVVGYVTNTTSTVTSTEALPGAPASAVLFIGQPFQVNYSANLNFGESNVDIGNAGTNGDPLLGPGFGAAAGNICVNVYAFDPNEELIACCSCLVTPSQTVNLGVNADLTSKTLTGVVPTSVTVKLLSTLAGGDGTGTACNNSAASAGTLANGMTAFRTTLHAAPVAGSFATTETQFTPATLSAGEQASITGRCASIIGNASSFGICTSCRAGALGGSKL